MAPTSSTPSVRLSRRMTKLLSGTRAQLPGAYRPEPSGVSGGRKSSYTDREQLSTHRNLFALFGDY